MAKTQYWLIKSEPTVYPYSQLEKDGKTDWTGIRNFEARNNLRAMKPGELCLYYHSNEGKAVVGVAKVLTAAGEDPTAPGEDWASVQVGPVVALAEPVDAGHLQEDGGAQGSPARHQEPDQRGARHRRALQARCSSWGRQRCPGSPAKLSGFSRMGRSHG